MSQIFNEEYDLTSTERKSSRQPVFKTYMSTLLMLWTSQLNKMQAKYSGDQSANLASFADQMVDHFKKGEAVAAILADIETNINYQVTPEPINTSPYITFKVDDLLSNSVHLHRGKGRSWLRMVISGSTMDINLKEGQQQGLSRQQTLDILSKATKIVGSMTDADLQSYTAMKESSQARFILGDDGTYSLSSKNTAERTDEDDDDLSESSNAVSTANQPSDDANQAKIEIATPSDLDVGMSNS